MTSEPTITHREERCYMGNRTVTPFKGMFAQVDVLIKDLRSWVKREGLADEGPFFLRYHVIDMAGPMDIEVGFVVPAHRSGTSHIHPGTLPAGHHAHLTYTGSGLAGNKTLLEWVRAQNITLDRWDDPAGDAFRCRYETYLTTDKLYPRRSKGVDLAIKIADE